MAYDPRYGGTLTPTTGTPSATVGQNGDYAIDATTAGGPYIYGPKANSTWPAAMGLGGAAGTPGNLYAPQAKSANYAVVANDLTGPTPLFLVSANGGSVTITVDASLLWSSGTSQSKALEVKRTDTNAANTVTLVGAGGQTIDGVTSVTLLPNVNRRVAAGSGTALYIL